MPSVARVLHQGVAADKPSADASLNQGWVYFETDTGLLQQSWNGVWSTISSPETTNVTVKLGEVIVPGGGAPTIHFPTISGSYRMLRLDGVLRSTAAAYTTEAHATINSDGGANYDRSVIFAVDTTLGSVSLLGETDITLTSVPGATAPVGAFATIVVEFPDYANAAMNKTYRSRCGYQGQHVATDFGQFQTVGYWLSTAAITDLVVTPLAGDWAEHSRVSLYGIL